MDSAKQIISSNNQNATLEDVNRLLEIGRLLLSVLTPEEIKTIQTFLTEPSTKGQLGNAGDS
jgi:hypothetical protein